MLVINQGDMLEIVARLPWSIDTNLLILVTCSPFAIPPLEFFHRIDIWAHLRGLSCFMSFESIGRQFFHMQDVKVVQVKDIGLKDFRFYRLKTLINITKLVLKYIFPQFGLYAKYRATSL